MDLWHTTNGRTNGAETKTLAGRDVPEDTTLRVIAIVVGRRVDGAARMTFEQQALVSRLGSAPPVVNLVGQALKLPGNSAVEVQPAVEDNMLVIRVTGVAGQTWDYHSRLMGCGITAGDVN